MKKITLCLLAAAIIGTSGFASAAKLSGAPGVPAVKTRLAYITSNASFVYCHYQTYNIVTGYIHNTYNRMYIARLFKGCPSR